MNICDICIRSECISELKLNNIKEKEKLNNELTNLRTREDATLAAISKRTKIVIDLEQNLKINILSHEERIECLEKEIENATKQRMLNEEEIVLCRKEIENSELNIQNLLDQYNINKYEVSKSTKEFEHITKKVDLLQLQVEQLIDECNKNIPYRRLRNTACNRCHNNIKLNMREDIFSIIEVQRTRSQSLICSLIKKECKIQKRNEMQCTCFIT